MVQFGGPQYGPRAGKPAREIVVLLHGVGADGRDLIELAPLLAQELPHALFVAPDGPEPCDMAAFGRQWFSLQDRRPSTMLAGIERTAPLLDAYLDGLLDRHGLEPGQMALLGFSQGTMMALHLALRRPRPLAAVLGYSGALIGADQLAAGCRSRPPVMLIHGDQDDIVPVDALFAATHALQAENIPVQWLVRPGLPHSIDEAGITAGAAFLKAALAND
jgi:phospholipase/carboxylesterase